MIKRYTPITVLAAFAAIGAAAWLAKLTVIVATGGATTDTGAAALFYLAGAGLLAIGSAAIGLRLTARRHVALRALAALASPVLFFASYALLDGIGKALAGDAGPAWLHDEAGTALTATAWLVVGLILLKGTRSTGPRPASA